MSAVPPQPAPQRAPRNAGASAAPDRLVIEDRDGARQVVVFAGDEITVGRAEQGNTVRLPERDVSRTHARFSRSNGSVWVEDLGSSNGTRVNGERIQGKRRIRPGDLVQIADYDIAVLGASEGPERLDPLETRTGPMSAVSPPRAAAAEGAAAAPAQGSRPRSAGIGRQARTLLAIGAVSLFLGWAAGRLLRPPARTGAPVVEKGAARPP